MPLFAQVGALPPAFSPPCRVGAEEPRGGRGRLRGSLFPWEGEKGLCWLFPPASTPL